MVRRNAVEVSHTRFSADSERLIAALERVFEKIAAEQREREEKARLEEVIAGLIYLASRASKSPPPQPPPVAAVTPSPPLKTTPTVEEKAPPTQEATVPPSAQRTGPVAVAIPSPLISATPTNIRPSLSITPYHDISVRGTVTIATVNNPPMIELKKLSTFFKEDYPNIQLNWVIVEENVLRQRVTTFGAVK